MKRSFLLLASAALLIPAALTLASFRATPQAPCANVFAHEPLVIYEVNGFTFGGFLDQFLIVYSDGSARLSRGTLDGTGTSTRLAHVGQDEAINLARNLVLLGARDRCDDPSIISDLPLSTLTVIGATTDARSHTYSWYHPEDPAAQAIQLRLQEFLATWFPAS